MGALTWLDTGEKDRRRTLEFTDTFRERDVQDEFGIGVARARFSASWDLHLATSRRATCGRASSPPCPTRSEEPQTRPRHLATCVPGDVRFEAGG